MKRLFLVLSALFFLALTTNQTWAQSQRLALQPSRFTLQGKGQTYEAEAFCLDRHLVITEKPVSYRKILSGQTNAMVRVGNRRPISLQQALDEHIISITGRAEESSERFATQLSLKFVSNEDAPVTIELTDAVAFGEKASWVNPKALAPLRQPQAALKSTLRQDMIWGAGTYERRLQVLGYYKAPPDDVNPTQLRLAFRDFQRAHNIPSTGIADLRTKTALDNAENALRAEFDQIGMSRHRTDTSVQDVSDVIRLYEIYLGRKETGLMSESLRARMAADKAALDQVVTVAELGNAPAADLTVPDIVPDVLTFQRYRKGSNVIVRTPEGPELWSYFNGKVIGRYKGRRAIEEFDNFSLAGATVSSSERMYVLQTSVYRPGGKIRVAFGPEKPLEFSSDEVLRFINGKSDMRVFDERVAKLRAGGAKRPRILISRSALNQGRGGDAGGGRPPLDGSGYEQIDPLRLALAWKRRYGDKCDIAIANDINLGLYNLEHLPTVNSGSKIRVFVDKTHFKDYGTIANVKSDLQGAGIKVVQAGNAEADQPNIILITGRNDVQFRAYLEQLARERRFENSVVALASCGEGCEVPFNSMIIRKSGARAVLFYDQRIHPQAVEQTLLKFSELLKKQGAPDGNFQQLLRQSVEELLKDRSTSMPEEVKKLRDAFLQVSALRPDGSDDTGE